MRILTLNTWKCDGPYGLRLQAMAAGIQALDPDVVALQECFVSTDGQHDTVRYLSHALGLHAQWAPARRKLRWVQGQLVDSWSGMAVLSRHPALECVSLQLPSNPADGGRLAQVALLRLTAGTPLALANVHLSHLPDAAGGTALRTQQLQAVLHGLSTRHGGQPQLVCGDFNATVPALWPPHASLPPGSQQTNPQGWTDLCAQLGMANKATHITDAGEPKDLDQMLCNRVMADTALSAHVVLNHPDAATGVLPSDHFGLMATFTDQ